MARSARNAYETGARATTSSRELEGEVLMKAARLLDACRRDWDASLRDGRLVQALEHNQRLWTFFQAELADPAHPMTPDLRSKLLSLSVFVDRRTSELRERPTAEGLETLVVINRELAQGLTVHPPGPEEPTR